MVADSHGTVWDTVFAVQPEEGHTRLTVVMDARAYKLLPKLMDPLICGMIRKSVEQNMDSVRVFARGDAWHHDLGPAG